MPAVAQQPRAVMGGVPARPDAHQPRPAPGDALRRRLRRAGVVEQPAQLVGLRPDRGRHVRHGTTIQRTSPRCPRCRDAVIGSDLRASRQVTDDAKEPADADPCPHEHECRRLRDHSGWLAGADRRSRLRLRREPRHPGVPRGLRGGADGPHDVRARPEQRALAVADAERLRARVAASAGNPRSRGERQRPAAAAGEAARGQPGRRRPPGRRPAHDRDLPRHSERSTSWSWSCCRCSSEAACS